MPNYEHEKLIKRIAELDQPPDDETAYANWITAGKHLDLLRQNERENEVIVYASDKYIFIHAVAINEDAIDPLDIDDLLCWSGNPFFARAAAYTWGGGRDDVWIERGSAIDGSKMFETARPFIFGREIMGLPGKSDTYLEVSQEYSHLSDIHYYPEHSGYCRFDEHGDLEYVVTITKKASHEDVALVTFKREPLEEYLAASRSVLVRMFDFAFLKLDEFNGWPDGPEDVVKRAPIFYRQKVASRKAAYTNGVQIVCPSRSRAEIFSKMKRETIGETAQYVDFVAHDWRNDRVITISTDPCITTNYFRAGGNSLPFELSPAFFKPEVLSKYKSDSDKYLIEDRRILCRGAWELRRYDVNEAEQVHAYICDLRRLPYSEQLYWKSFSEEPKAGISERAIAVDFEGQWGYRNVNPLMKIKHMLERWQQSDVPWWKLRDPASAGRVTSPLAGSRDEWAQAFTNLAQFIIEGFDSMAARAKLDEMGMAWEHDEKSIALLGRLLSGGAADGCTPDLKGLRLVQRIRSKVGAHARGTEADALATRAMQEHGSYAAHFESVCRNVAIELQRIERAFGPISNTEDQGDLALSEPLSADIDEVKP